MRSARVVINSTAFVAEKGLESAGHPIMFGVLAAALAITGPGRYALDAGRPWHRGGFAVAGASIGLALLTELAALLSKG